VNQITFKEAASSVRNVEQAADEDGLPFGDILIVELEGQIKDDYGDDENQDIRSPLELVESVRQIDKELFILICSLANLEGEWKGVSVIPCRNPAAIFDIRDSRRLGTRVYEPVSLEELLRTYIPPEKCKISERTKRLLAREMSDLNVQYRLAVDCFDLFGDVDVAAEAVIVARVFRYLATLTNEGRNFRTGVVMVNGFSDWTASLDRVVIKPLTEGIRLDMIGIDILIRLLDGIDGITSVLVANREGIADCLAVSHLETSGFDVDDFLSVSVALGGLGFFLPGDKSLFVFRGSREAKYPSLQHNSRRWLVNKDEQFFKSLQYCISKIEGSEYEVAIAEKIHALVRYLSRYRLGSFILFGDTKRFYEQVEKGTLRTIQMRRNLTTSVKGFSIVELPREMLVQMLSLDGAHLINLDGKVDEIGMLLFPTVGDNKVAGVGKSQAGTKRTMAQLVTKLCKDLLAVTVSRDGPASLWFRGELVVNTDS
jgi:hypothetical protein